MKRVLTAIILIAVVIALVLFGKLWMITLVAALIAILAALEFRTISAASAGHIPLWWTIAAILLFFAVVSQRPQDTLTALAFATLVLFIANALTTGVDRVLGETASGLLLLLYIAYPLTLLPQIWSLEHGTALLLFLFLCVWSGDIAALYVGKRFGRHKLSALSPNKTWEGAIASVVAAVIFGMALILAGDYLTNTGSNVTSLHTSAPWGFWLLLAIGLNIAAQFGDLLESALKRGANIQDSGTLLPGHGGILDRIDALLLAAPALWFVWFLRDYYSLGNF
jgi:phosphatidate cytidylyltransferase